MEEPSQARPWRTPEELVEIGFSRARVVMMNEAHSGDERCVRTREIGRRILSAVHGRGVQHLAMEALIVPFVEEENRTRQSPEVPADYGYLAQPDMKALMQAALDLGWTLVPYEADFSLQPPGLSHRAENNWREEMQARNLAAALNALPVDAKLLVWCGWAQHNKVPVLPGPGGSDADEPWLLMGYHFKELSSIDPFVIDQTLTVHLPGLAQYRQDWLEKITPQLTSLGGTAGFLREEAPLCLKLEDGVDAWIASLDNEME